jgi:uncharacterized protein (DUF488 family)
VSARRLATIGVYGFSGEAFIAALGEARVWAILDVRQRRGVRGREYAWANSRRIQVALARAGITYTHLKQLAPTTELRHLQYAEDDRLGVGKRSRIELAPEYARRYTEEILDPVGVRPVVESMAPEGTSALLCVERDPEACHRSLIAARVAEIERIPVVHLRP